MDSVKKVAPGAKTPKRSKVRYEPQSSESEYNESDQEDLDDEIADLLGSDNEPKTN